MAPSGKTLLLLAAAAGTGLAAGAPGALRGSAQGQGGAPSAARSGAFVFLFEWSWDDIAVECEQWLGPKGFTAVQISPPSEHQVGSSWSARYKPVSYNLTSRSGNETQFASMVQRCRTAGVGVYADAVFNQQAPYSGVGVAGSAFGYRTYPLYSPEDFHHLPYDTSTNCGVDNYQNATNVWSCDLSGMPDLCTGCPHVQDTVSAYINRMARIGITGFRVDAAKHMNPSDLKGVMDRVNSSLYRFQEVIGSPGEAVTTEMYVDNGDVTEFGYPATLAPKFIHDGELRDDLARFGEDWGLMRSSDAVVFLDNHDTQRNGQAWLTYKSGYLYVLANVFMLAYPYGYPRVMSSYFFDQAYTDAGPPATPVHGPDGQLRCGWSSGWVCEHRNVSIANMVHFRHRAGDLPVANFVSAGDALAFCRGGAACVAINRAAGGDAWEAELTTTMPEGEYCNVFVSDVAADCPRVHVAADGKLSMRVPPRSAVAIHVGAPAR